MVLWHTSKTINDLFFTASDRGDLGHIMRYFIVEVHLNRLLERAVNHGGFAILVIAARRDGLASLGSIHLTARLRVATA